MSILKKMAAAVCGAAMVVAVGLASCVNTYAKDADGDYVVVIDPGHGANESGAVSLGGGIEATFNWNIAVAFKAELETYSGVKVYLTKGSAEPMSNSGRAHVAESLNADLTISCHNNSGGGGTSKGALILANADPRFSAMTNKIGQLVLAELSPYVGTSGSGIWGRTSDFKDGNSFAGGTAVNYYTFIDEATKAGIPSLMIEHCFVDNAENSAFINVLENQYKLGYGDATAVAKYFGLSKRTVAAGGSVNLIRTYSAKITGATGGYKSSNEAVAKVTADGLITAVGAGTATISTNAGSVNVTVPAVKMVGIAAGITPTMYRNQADFLNSNKGNATVKALYSDGTAVQINGASIGSTSTGTVKTYSYSDGSQSTLTEMNTPISYNGFSCVLKTYYGPKVTTGSFSSNLSIYYTPQGTNKDIVHIPGNYTSAAGSLPTNQPTQAPATQGTTQQTATVAPTTQAGTQNTSAESVENSSEAVTKESGEKVDQSSTESIAESATQVNTEAGKSMDIIPILIGLIVVLGAGLVGGIWLAIKRR